MATIELQSGLIVEEVVEKVGELTDDEVARVAGSWIDQPGVVYKDSTLVFLGEFLMRCTPERATKIKEAFPDEWECWDESFDEYGRLLVGVG